MTSETPWLDEHQQRIWRRWLLVQRRLKSELERDMQRGSELSGADFEVLVNLTDVPDGRLRMSELAEAMDWERSRLSHQVRRMEARGLVERRDCPEDGRGQFVAITPGGRTAIEHAAPDHVRAVRRFMIDALTPEELDKLGEITEKVLARLNNA